MRAARRKVFYQPQAKIVHLEGQTQGTDESGGIKRHQVSIECPDINNIIKDRYPTINCRETDGFNVR